MDDVFFQVDGTMTTHKLSVLRIGSLLDDLLNLLSFMVESRFEKVDETGSASESVVGMEDGFWGGVARSNVEFVLGLGLNSLSSFNLS